MSARKARGGGGARNPRSLANLQRGRGRPASSEHRPAVSHGGYARIAQRDLDAKRRELYDALGDDLPLREANGAPPRHDALAVRLLAEALCRLDSVSEYLDRRGWEADDGGVRPAADLERRLRAEVLDLARELGLTPAARARLGVDLVRVAASAEDAEAARAARERLDVRADALDGDATPTEEDEEMTTPQEPGGGHRG